MEMIIGGAWQGKSAYARQHYPGISFLEGREISEEELLDARGVLNLHHFIRKEMLSGKDLSDFAEKLLKKNRDLVLTVQELGCGVVPVDPFERDFRETAGRICTALAADSRKVVRIIAGIPVVLKETDFVFGIEGAEITKSSSENN